MTNFANTSSVVRLKTPRVWQMNRESLLAAAELKKRGLLRIGRPRGAVPFCPWEPTDLQRRFIESNVRDCLYGGAAGGGKSVALLMAALRDVNYPNYRALLLRKSFQDLTQPNALIPLSKEWLTGLAEWNEQRHEWTFPSGAVLRFGFLERERDRDNYQGAAYHFIGVDELTQHIEGNILYLFSRQRRRAGDPIPIRFRASANPGGVGHAWVRDRYITNPTPTRLFIPAKLNDNPYLDREEYIESLNELDPVTRRQLLDGDWDVLPSGKKFKPEWFTDKRVALADVPALRHVVRAWDVAATLPHSGNRDPDFTAGVKMGVTPNGLYYILDVVCFRGTPLQVESRIRQVAEQDGKAVEIYMEQEPGSSGVAMIDHYRREVLPGYTFYGVPASGSGAKEIRANPLASQAEAGNVYLVDGHWVTPFLQELCAFPTDGVHDDQVDASSLAFSKLRVKPVAKTRSVAVP